MHRNTVTGLAAAVLLTSATLTPAALLAPKHWVITGPDGVRLTQITDNDLDTAWTSTTPQQPGLGVTIDLGAVAVVHRLYLNPGRAATHFPRSVRLLAGPDAAHLLPVQEITTLADQETNLKFNPVAGRVFRVEIGREGSGLPWSIAELELYGSYDPAAWPARDAVVVDPKAAEPLLLAARELRYYIGELTGRPLPIIAPDQTNTYPGTLYTIVDLAPLTRTYDEMQSNQKAGLIPTNAVNVARDGRAVLFRAWPYANVLNSVWEFLERQGVRWAYPSEQGDFVPSGRGVNLDILPLTYTPPGKWRYANFDTKRYGTNPCSDPYLYWWRSRWTSSWNDPDILGGKEVPLKDSAKSPVVGKGFEGVSHNFDTVVPNDVLLQHPDWCGMYRGIMNKDVKPDSPAFGKRLAPGQGGPTFCMSNPELIEWVAKKAIDSVSGNPAAEGLIWLVPMDAARYCECERCMKLIEPVEVDNMVFEFGGWASVSEAYYYFVSEVAKKIGKVLPKVQVGALVYSTCHRPPRHVERLPDNMVVKICLYGAMSLPLSHPANAEMLKRLETWHKLCARTGIYSYMLIHGQGSKMPVPLVSAMSDWIRVLNRFQALGSDVGRSGGGCEASNDIWFNPWNYYALPHMEWNPQAPPEFLLKDFFAAYYRESSEPMLAYYSALEDQVLKQGIDLHMGAYGYGPKPEALTPSVLRTMEACLDNAGKSATHWLVKERIGTAREGFSWTKTQVTRQTSGPADAVKSGKAIYPCYRRVGDVRIDGKLDDAAWQACPAATGFTIPATGRPAVLRQTEFRMAWDDENLYVAVQCQEPNVAAMKRTEGDAYFNDSVEIFFAPAKGKPTPYYRLALTFDGRHVGPTLYLGSLYNPQKTEPVPCQTAAATGEGVWSVEAAVPFQALGGAPKAGAAWYANVCRNVRVADGLAENCTTWSALPMLNWHFYDEYNSIVFQQDPLTPDRSKAIDEEMSGVFRSRQADRLKRYRQNEETLQRVKGACNLVLNPKGAPSAELAKAWASSGAGPERLTCESGGWMIYNNSPQCCEIAWPRPVAFSTVVVRFSSQYQLVTAYGLEYFDGASWHALADEQDNVLSVGVVRTAKAVQATRLRLYVYQPFAGYRKVDRIEVYE